MHHFPYWRLSAYYFAYFAFLGVFSPYFGLYLQSRAFSAWDIGLLMSQMQLMRLFGPYLWGALADRLGKRLFVIRLTSVGTLVAFSAFFWIKRFDAYMAAMAILAFFWSASLPLVEALTFDHLRENAARYSRVRLWGSVGFIAAVLASGALLDFLPLDAVLWFTVASLLAIVVSSMSVPDAAAHQSHEDSAPVAAILTLPSVRALLAAGLCMQAAHGAMNIFYSIYIAGLGYSKSVVGGLFSLGVVAEIAMFFFMSRVMRRYSLRRILIASFAVAVGRFLLIGWFATLPVLIFAQTLHSLTFGAFHAASIAAINHWFRGSARARGQALYSSLAFGAGGLLGGLASGWSWDHLGGGMAFTLSSLFALIGLVLVVKWVTMSEAEEPRESDGVDVSSTVRGSHES
ncbi:MAG: MFS transporter [Propionivibrio sp.]|nr:MFS transporter [Propionivibrio sp.]